MIVEIWHNPRCSKSRATLRLLEEAGVEVRVRRYLEDPPSVRELDRALELLGMEPEELARTGETVGCELELVDRRLSRADWIRTLARHPILLQRPVVLTDDGRAVVGRPPETVEYLLEPDEPSGGD